LRIGTPGGGDRLPRSLPGKQARQFQDSRVRAACGQAKRFAGTGGPHVDGFSHVHRRLIAGMVGPAPVMEITEIWFTADGK